MAAVRSLFQIPVLIKLTKSLIQNCYGCKRFRATHYPNPKLGPLPIDWMEQIQPFEIIVTDYAGRLYCTSKVKRILKHTSCYFHVVLPKLYIQGSCQILLLLILSKVLRNQEEESETSYIQIMQKPLRQEKNCWTVLADVKSSMIFFSK